MRIVNKNEFYKLPSGTLYSDFEPTVFTGLKIKGETIYDGLTPIDYFYTDLIGNIEYDLYEGSYDKVLEGLEKKESLKLDFETLERDGLYDENSCFAIYENQDIVQFIDRITKCIKTPGF